MSKEVSVANFDVLRLGLRKELDRLKKKIGDGSNSNRGISLSMEVNGMNDLMQILLKLMDYISTLDFKPEIELNPSFTIPDIKLPEINIPEIKAPSVIVPTPNVTVNPEVNVDVRGIISALENLKYLSDRPNKPIAVRMSDGQKFVKAVQDLQKATEQLGVVYSGSSGLSTDDLKIYSGREGTDFLYGENGARLTPKFAKIDAATSGDNTLVAAVSGKKIRVLQLFLVSSGTVATRFESGAGGTALTGQMNLIANTGYSLPYSPVGLFETAAGELLNLELSGAVSVDGSLTYIEV
jgi:hypothetical protein